MFYQNDITDTLNAVRALAADGDVSKGLDPDIVKSFTSTLGLIPYNLEPGAKLLAPVLTPVRNLLPRTKGYGRNVEFKAITSYNSANASAWTTEGTSGAEVSLTSVDVVFPYRIAGLRNYLSLEGFYTSKGQVDAKSLMMANLLRALMIDEEDRLLFANPTTAFFGTTTQNNNPYPYPGYVSPWENVTATGAAVAYGGSISAGAMPTLTTAGGANPTTALSATSNYTYICSTGGSIGAFSGGFDVQVATISGPDYGFGNAKTYESYATTLVTTSASVGGTNQLVVNLPAVGRGVAFVVYYKAHADTYWYRTVTNGRLVVLTYTTLGGALPGTPVPKTSDNTGNANAYVGIMQQILSSAAGAGVGAFVYDKQKYPNPTGSPFTLNANPATTNDLDTFFQQMWTQAKADPAMLLMNSAESISISNSLAGTPFFVQPQGMQNETLGGYRVSRFINKVTGSYVDIRVHPTMPQGTIAGLSFQMPPWYPNGDISNVWEFNALYDYLSLEYAVTQPQLPIEVRNMGAVVGYFPVINGVLTNISLL